MQDFINTFFSVKFLPFVLVFSLVFSRKQPKRRYFWLRLLVGFAVSLVYYFLWEYIKGFYSSPFFPFITFLVQLFAFTLTVLFNWNCFECSFFEAILYAIGGWTTESFSGAVAVIIGLKAGFEGVVYRDYSVEYFVTVLIVALLSWILFDVVFSLLCKDRKINLDKRGLLVPVTVIFAVFVSLNLATSSLFFAEPEKLIYVKYYNLACCVLLLSLILNMFYSGRYRLQIETLEQLDKKQQEQYLMSKDTVDIINTKCHDLKKMLASSLADGKIMTKEEMEKLQEKISIYDSLVQTGNKALDLVLSEKSLYCEKNGIQLSVMATFSRLDFMSKVDIYSLFANILDNAIEAVMKLEKSKRIITLSVKEVGEMLIVHEDNNFDGEIRMADGKIETRKQDKSAHGYGLLSIRRVSEKYGGSMKAGRQENVFYVNVLIPIKK